MSAPNNARLVAELQAVTLGINLVGLDRLPEVMRDGAALAQTQGIATMTDTNTVHGGAVAWRYRYPKDDAWQLTQDHDQAFKNTGEVEPLGVIPFAPQTDTDAREKVVEALEVIQRETNTLREDDGLVEVRGQRLTKWWVMASDALAALKTGDA